MKRTILTWLITACVLSCAKAEEPMGPGVSVDAQGSLVIDAPLYVIDHNPEKPGLKPADPSMNRPVSVSLYAGDDIGSPLEFVGGIINGRLSLTIKKPDNDQLYFSVASFWHIPDDFFKTGNNVAIAELWLQIFEPDHNHWLILYSNPIVKLSESSETDYFYVTGDQHHYAYSLGDIRISGRVSIPLNPLKTWHRDYDVSMRQGWNVTRYTEISAGDDVTAAVSVPPPADAVWVLHDGY